MDYSVKIGMEEHADFIIPEKFLKQLEEFSNGGFIVLTFTKKGNPAAYQYYETKKDQMALEAFLEKFTDKVNRSRFEETEATVEPEDNDEDDKERA